MNKGGKRESAPTKTLLIITSKKYFFHDKLIRSLTKYNRTKTSIK